MTSYRKLLWTLLSKNWNRYALSWWLICLRTSTTCAVPKWWLGTSVKCWVMARRRSLSSLRRLNTVHCLCGTTRSSFIGQMLLIATPLQASLPSSVLKVWKRNSSHRLLWDLEEEFYIPLEKSFGLSDVPGFSNQNSWSMILKVLQLKLMTSIGSFKGKIHWHSWH